MPTGTSSTRANLRSRDTGKRSPSDADLATKRSSSQAKNGEKSNPKSKATSSRSNRDDTKSRAKASSDRSNSKTSGEEKASVSSKRKDYKTSSKSRNSVERISSKPKDADKRPVASGTEQRSSSRSRQEEKHSRSSGRSHSKRSERDSRSSKSSSSKRLEDTEAVPGQRNLPEDLIDAEMVDKPSSSMKTKSSGKRKLWDKDNIVTDLAEEIVEEETNDDDVHIGKDNGEPIEEDFTNNQGEKGDDDNAYDDDFEDYDDDDFEDEEDDDEDNHDDGAKVDTGSYDGKSAFDRARMEREMTEVKTAMRRENSARYPRSVRRDHDADVNREDSPKAREENREETEENRRPQRVQSGRGFINFNSAKERHKSQVAAGKAAKRGDKLLGMIRLDVVAFDLFEMPPIKYEAFMKSFGATNTMQAFTQTGEDNADEESQTEPIIVLDKWTQKPPTSALAVGENSHLLVEAIRGVGGEEAKEYDQDAGPIEFASHSDSYRLSRFLANAGPALLTLLEETSTASTERDATSKGKTVDFSDMVTVINGDENQSRLAFLAQRPITAINFAPDQPSMLVTVHGPSGDNNNNDDDESLLSSFLCVWQISFPSSPQKVLVAHNVAHVCSFSPFKASLLFAGETLRELQSPQEPVQIVDGYGFISEGLEDGAVNVWDLRERNTSHQEVLREQIDDLQEFVVRSPTFTTFSSESEGDLDDTHGSHSTRVTAIKPLPEAKDDADGGGRMHAFRLVTIEERGSLIIWTVLDSHGDLDLDNHVGLAHWGSVRLVRSVAVDLGVISIAHNPELRASDITFDPHGDGASLFVATDNGMVLHGSVHQDHKPNPRSFRPEFDTRSGCTSVDYCPFGEAFFLVGCDDGTVRLHSTANERPIVNWPGTVDGQPVAKVVWSTSRPCVFFVMDTKSRVHLWDLSSGDIFPAHTVQFGSRVTSITVSPDLKEFNSRQKQLLAVGMANGRIEVHHLMDEFKAEHEEACSKELSRFLHYISII